MSKKTLSITASVALLFGIVVGKLLEPLPFFSPGVMYSLLLLALVAVIWTWEIRRARVIVLAFSLFFLSVFRVSILPPQSIFSQSQFQGTGVIVSLPEIGEKTQRFVFHPDTEKGNVTVIAPLYPTHRYGQWLDLTCRTIEQGFCSFPEIHVLANGKGNPLLQKLFAVKAILAENLRKVLPEPHAGFAQALVLGQRGAIPSSLRESFTRTGTNHIVAISGMHIVILSQILAFLLGLFPLPRKTRFLSSAVLLAVFTAMIGAPASAIRGLLFGLLLLLSQYTGRIRTMTPALLWTAAVMLLVQPSFLFELGFQLSFLATVGIVYGVPIFRYYGTRARGDAKEHRAVSGLAQGDIVSPSGHGLSEASAKERSEGERRVSGARWAERTIAEGNPGTARALVRGAFNLILMSLAATLTTTPLILATIGRTTLWTIPTNLLLVPLFEIVLPLTLFVAIIAPIPLLGSLAAFVLTIFFDVILGILRIFSSLPGHTIVFSAFSHTTLFALYVALFALGRWLFERIPYRERTCFVADSPSSS